MKNLFTLSLIILSFGSPALLHSQGAANLGFENWTSSIIGDSPSGWVSLNASQETTDVYEGTSSIKLETKNSVLGIQPGLATIGKMQGLNVIPGEPYTNVPASITGYIKYNLAYGDTALFYIRLTNQTEIIASADTMFAGAQENWTQFTLNIDWYAWGVPDSIQIGITSGGNSDLIGFDIGTLTVGSWLIADAFSLSNFSSIGNMVDDDNSVKVFPNPSRGTVYIANARQSDIYVYNMLGKKVMEFKDFNNDRINMLNLPNGNYIIQVNKNNSVTTHKIILTK